MGDERKWVGGVARSHEELDEVDAQFWHDARPAMRFIASIELAFTAWALEHPNENDPPDLPRPSRRSPQTCAFW